MAAKLSFARFEGTKFLTAFRADLYGLWLAMSRVFSLIGKPTFLRAELAPAFLPGKGDREFLATFNTRKDNFFTKSLYRTDAAALLTAIGQRPMPITNINPGNVATSGTGSFEFPSPSLDFDLFHANSISHIAYHSKGNTTVYNLEVEGDHTYIANGFVVHNCIACAMLHGSIHPLDEPMSSHPQCRCTQIPETLSLREMGIEGVEEPPPVIQEGDGQRWLENQSVEEQQRLMGKPMYAAWQAGRITPEQFVAWRRDSVWGDMPQPANLHDLLGGSAAEFYGEVVQ